MLALGALLLLPGLGAYPLIDPTEARHAAVARAMAREGRLAVPSLYGEPYYDKPAPYYLLLRAAERLPLRVETALRLPSALAVLATAWLLFGFARARLGTDAAALGAAIFLACPLVVALGRFADQDALLCALVTLAIVGWLEALDDPDRSTRPAWLAMGIGSWVKGPVAIALPMLVVAAVALSRGRLPARAFLVRAIAGTVAASALFALWVVPTWFIDADYVQTFLFRHNLDRFAEGSTGHPKPFWFYVPVLLGALLPWSLLLPAALAGPRTRRTEEDAPGPGDAARRELLAWAIAIVGFFSLARAKSANYVLPALGPIALWLAARLVSIARATGVADARAGDPAIARIESRLRGALATLAALAAAAPLGAWLFLSREYPRFAPQSFLLLPIALVAGLVAAAAWRHPRPLHATVLAFGVVATCLLVGGFVVGAPLAASIASDRHLARFAARAAPGVPLVGFRLHPASLAFYSPGPVGKTTDVERVKRLAAAGPVLVLARERDEIALEEAGLHLYRWTRCERHCLFGSNPLPAWAGPEATAEESDGGAR